MAEKKEEKILAPDPEEVVERRYMRESEHGDKTIFCSVNGTAIYVPCGKSVKIKRKYAEVIDRSFTKKERGRERAEAFARGRAGVKNQRADSFKSRPSSCRIRTSLGD